MTAQPTRTRVKAVVVALCGIAALTAAAVASVPAAAARRPQAPASAAAVAAARLPVVVNCAGRRQVRPHQYILACADGNAFLTGLHWSAWGSASAFASGTTAFNDCIPSCVAGHLHKFPALIALWRAEPLPGHAGLRYFTRVTIIYTGRRSYRAGGKVHHLPQTATGPLSASGGA
jgi:hypothetical protein